MKIVNAIGNIDDKLIEAAEKSSRKPRRPWIKWCSAAAAAVVLVIAGLLTIPHLTHNNNNNESGRVYRYHVNGAESNIVWPWEYLTDGEKYHTISLDDTIYSIRNCRTIGDEFLGEIIGEAEASGTDDITGKKYTATFKVRKIKGIAPEYMVAAGNGDDFYVYMAGDAKEPATVGELLANYNLRQNMRLDHFTECYGYDEKGDYSIKDDSYIWDVLAGCPDAKLCQDDAFNRDGIEYLTFCVSSDALGVYKKVIYISESGYLETNILDYGYTFYIGEKQAREIIDYAKKNGSKAEKVVYEASIEGTLTEIGDGYVLIDDSILCEDAGKGRVYKVYTDDIRMRRCIELGNIQTGDIVSAKYDGDISKDNEVRGAYSIYTGELVRGGLAIPE
ncbi:MAG: hypothetical protein PUB17_10875 [Lachnospiraceae bacterium]|nr:hypothetical protein [Lachnospiraceae bacterium]